MNWSGSIQRRYDGNRRWVSVFVLRTDANDDIASLLDLIRASAPVPKGFVRRDFRVGRSPDGTRLGVKIVDEREGTR